MAKKLIIDLKKCKQCDKCEAVCSYKHHPENNGIDALLEQVRFSLICRKCEMAPCVNACPQEALEKVPLENEDESVLKRYNMLCTGCGTCAMACPFGTIYSDLVPFVSSVCDLCRERISSDQNPLCVETCPYDSLEYRQVEANDNMIEVLPGVIVKVEGGQLWQPLKKNKKG